MDRAPEAGGIGPADGTSEWFRAITTKKERVGGFQEALQMRSSTTCLGHASAHSAGGDKGGVRFHRFSWSRKWLDAGDVQANGFQIVEAPAKGKRSAWSLVYGIRFAR